MFYSTRNSGFQMVFKNGWTVSVQFGPDSYSSNKNSLESSRGIYESKTAEVAAWDSEKNWYDFGTDTVEGYQTTDDVLAFCNKIAAMPAKKSGLVKVEKLNTLGEKERIGKPLAMPEVDKPFVLVYADGSIFRTSPVTAVYGKTFDTENSTYKITEVY